MLSKLLCFGVAAGIASISFIGYIALSEVPQVTFMNLARRGRFQTAGYITGDPAQPITCDGTSTYSYGTDYVFGCCGASGCSKPNHCQSNGVPYCGGVGSANCVYSQIIQCTNAAFPSCATYTLKTSSEAPFIGTSFGCVGNAATAVLVLVDATATLASSVSSASSVVSSSVTAAPGSITTSTTPPATTMSSQSSTSSSTSSSSSSASQASSSGGGVTSSVTASSMSGTTASTTTSSSAAATTTNTDNVGGYTEDQKIALATGISIPIVALAVASWALYETIQHRKKKKARRAAAAAAGGGQQGHLINNVIHLGDYVHRPQWGG